MLLFGGCPGAGIADVPPGVVEDRYTSPIGMLFSFESDIGWDRI
jgi:hypothetical protein